MIKSASLKPLIIQSDVLRLSLAGAQNKSPVYYENDQCSLPKGNAPSSHILKIASPGFPDLIENEFFCMKLAEKAGAVYPHVLLNHATVSPDQIQGRVDAPHFEKRLIPPANAPDFAHLSGRQRPIVPHRSAALHFNRLMP
ncbi:HipA domain-containing protein [Desulfoluna limicola]|uniref:HipA domain-containing protein n=1 Tax=Desulfoluna limicola TaxID=2810562 RepID=UPI003BF59C96